MRNSKLSESFFSIMTGGSDISRAPGESLMKGDYPCYFLTHQDNSGPFY